MENSNKNKNEKNCIISYPSNNLSKSKNNIKNKNINQKSKNKQKSKKSLSDGEIHIEKADNKMTFKENNFSNKKNTNNLSNFKNKPINNLTKAPDNLTVSNYFSDNNINNKDCRQICKNVIDDTPTFYRNPKAEQNDKAKGICKINILFILV